MTIGELIDALLDFPPEAEVFLSVNTKDGKLREDSIQGVIYSNGEIELLLKEHDEHN